VALGLATVHAAGVVHRDLKPENVLVGHDRDGAVHAWLTDFGVAGAVSPAAGRRLTRASRLVGTPEYVAPELAAGRQATGAADVYALGVLAYETLSGRRPFDAEHPAALLRAHLEDVPQRPDGMTEEVWTLVAACLAKDPADRPDATRVAAAFTALAGTGSSDAGPLAALPAASGATPPPYLSPASDGESHPAALLTSDATRPAPPAPPPLPADRRRRWPWVAAVAALAVIGIAAGAWLGRPDSGPTRPPTPRASTFQGTVAVPVVVDSPRKGDIRLRFPGGSTVPGVQAFFVVRDGTVAAQGLAPTDQDWTAADLDARTQHCWAVFAVVESPRPVPSPAATVAPVCQQANGRDSQ
jgi:serine/threonine-protein kinase